jgi:LysM repeat protein
VQPGDELKHIAAEEGVNIFTLIAANKIDDPDNLRVGQVLKIPD